MKTPLILKIFAVLNLLLALLGLVIGAAATIDFSDNYTIWNREIILSLYIVLCSAWLLIGSLSWFFGFRSAYSLLIISVLSVFSFLIGVLNYAMEVGINRKDEKLALSALIIGFSVYGIFMLSSVFSKQVKDWKAARPEMKKLILPMLIVFSVMVYGSHLAIEFGRTESSQDNMIEALEEMEYGEAGMEDFSEDFEEEAAYDDEYYEEEYDDGSYGDFAYYNEPYVESAPVNSNKIYPAPSGGNAVSTTEINGILTAFFTAFLSNDWIRQDAFREENSLTIKLASQTHNVGTYHLGMASIYEYINPYFTSRLSTPVTDCNLYCYAEKLSGINPLLVRSDNDRSFNQYNPEIIKWMYTYLVPKSDTNFMGNIMAKQLYGKVFRRFFRLYTQAYCYLIMKDYETEKQAYINAAAQSTDFYGPSYLFDRYNGEISAQYDGSLEPTSAIGFWLRRGIDNTDDECWLGIQKVMNQYDAAWFTQIKSVYLMESSAQ
jgi:hypothetical protein